MGFSGSVNDIGGAERLQGGVWAKPWPPQFLRTDGVVARLPLGTIPKAEVRFGRVLTRKGSNVNAANVAIKRPRSSMREKEIWGYPAELTGHICAPIFTKPQHTVSSSRRR